MLDTVFIGMSGLTGYSKGLRVIGNNLTNVNSPGFKGSQLQFADLFYQGSASGRLNFGGQSAQLGMGLNTLATTVNFKAGELRQTGGDLDLAVNGEGYFVLHEGEELRYTRAGQFQFDTDGFLVSATSGLRAHGLDETGRLVDISLEGLRSNPAKATTSVKFTGNLSSAAAADIVLNSVTLIDAVGGTHDIKLTFKNNGATTPGNWTVTATEGSTTLGTGTLQFNNGAVVAGSSKISFTYAPSGVEPFPIELDFSADVTSSAGATTVAVDEQDGFITGALTKVTFDEEGRMIANYSNGETVEGIHLALARFNSNQDIVPLGGSEFGSASMNAMHIGRAKTQSFGTLASGVIEGANVDLAEEFSNLIVMQRGYQASSHVISTANDMIQELFDMKGRR